MTPNIIKYNIDYNDKLVTFESGFDLLQHDDVFRSHIINELNKSSMNSFYFETPPIDSYTIKDKFEFMILKADLHREANFESFQKYFVKCNENTDIVSFLNINGDATLIVPCPVYENSNYLKYAHFADFLRHAPRSQIHHLFMKIGKKSSNFMKKNSTKERFWLSTSGGGVPWLHVRMDSIPKYINWKPYKKISNEDQSQL